MKKIFILMISLLFSQFENEKLYITIQMQDQVGIINVENNQLEQIVEIEIQNEISEIDCMSNDTESSCEMMFGCEWMTGMCMESSESEINTPHFIVMDEILGYWFVTTIASGYVAQYSLLDNQFIDAYFVGDAPAILTIDTQNKKLYCSRMMAMNGMGNMMPSSESSVIHALNYSNMGLSEATISEYQINSPTPHGLTINDDGTEIFTASNTADWLYKINTITGEITGVVMDQEVSNPPDQETQRLKPIQCLSTGNKLFISCSAGVWMNPWTGEQTIIPGQLQMWNSDDLTLIETIEFGDYTGPWHIAKSPVDDLIYVALSGDNLYDTEGVAAVRFDDNTVSLEWLTNNSLFDTLHGIDISNDGQRVYVSGRGDGYIHLLNNYGEYVDNIFIGNMTMLGGISILKKELPELGDSNNDQIINVIDIIQMVNFIIGQSMLSPYAQFSSDFNNDSIINVVDIISVINLIVEN